jgi:ankyrin repeat protein
MKDPIAIWHSFRDTVVRHPLCRYTILPAGIFLAIWLAVPILVLLMWGCCGRGAYGFWYVLGELSSEYYRFFHLGLLVFVGVSAWLLTGRGLPTVIGLVPIGLSLDIYLQKIRWFHCDNSWAEMRLMWKRLAVFVLAWLWLLFLDWRKSTGRPAWSWRMKCLAGLAAGLLILAGLALVMVEDPELKGVLLQTLSAAVWFTVFFSLAWHLLEAQANRRMTFLFAGVAMGLYVAMAMDGLGEIHLISATLWCFVVVALLLLGSRILSKNAVDRDRPETASSVTPDAAAVLNKAKWRWIGVGAGVVLLVAMLSLKMMTALATQHLFAICRTGTPEQLQRAIAFRANVNAQHYGSCPLMEAAGWNPNPKAITVLLQAGAKVNAHCYAGTPVSYAVQFNPNPEVLKVLLQAGADVNANRSFRGRTPLMIAVAEQGKLPLCIMLIQAGAKVNARDDDGNTPLMCAIQSRNPSLETFRALIAAGADVNAKDNSGMTPLIWNIISSGQNPEILKALIAADADINAKDNDGDIPLIVAARHGWTPEVLQTLLQAGAKVPDGMALLMVAAGNYNDNPQIVMTLLKSASEINAKDQAGRTLLMQAAASNREKTVAALLEKGVEINAKDKDGRTPLIYAAQHACVCHGNQTIQTLIQAGAEVNAKDNQGRSALDYAREAKGKKIIELLIGAGAK